MHNGLCHKETWLLPYCRQPTRFQRPPHLHTFNTFNTGAGGAPALAEQLSRKSLRHDMLLSALEAGGALARLPPAVGGALFAAAEQLAAAGGALELLPELAAAVQEGVPGEWHSS